MVKGAARYRVSLLCVALLSGVVATACDDAGGEVIAGSGPSRGVRVFVMNESQAPFTLEGRTVDVGATSLCALHVEPETRGASFEIARNGNGMARISYRIVRVPDGSRDARIVVTEPSAGTFLARSADSKWVEVLDLQLF